MYIAHFQAEGWVRDYAIPLDPEGEEEWNCTAYIATLDEKIQKEIAVATKNGASWVDNDDRLRNDPAIPEWAANWHGPFTITVKFEESAS